MKVLKSLPFRLLVGVVLGIVVGLLIPDVSKMTPEQAALPSAVLQIIVTVKFILNQLISFCVPLIIIGFIAPSIVKLGSNASRMLGVALLGDAFLLPIKIVVAGLVMVWNYLGRKIFVYGGKDSKNTGKGNGKNGYNR